MAVPIKYACMTMCRRRCLQVLITQLNSPKSAVVGEMELTDGDSCEPHSNGGIREPGSGGIDYAGTVSASIHNASNGERIAFTCLSGIGNPGGWTI